MNDTTTHNVESLVSNFGKTLWEAVTRTSLSSISKKEWELMVVGHAIESGLVGKSPADVATAFRLSLHRAKGYLSELALREEALTDFEALPLLVKHLLEAEVQVSSSHVFVIEFNDLRLLHWCERKLSSLRLQAGESLRGDTLRLSLIGLGGLFDNIQGMPSPSMALKELEASFAGAPWFRAAKKEFKPRMGWRDILGSANDGVSIIRDLAPVAVTLVG